MVWCPRPVLFADCLRQFLLLRVKSADSREIFGAASAKTTCGQMSCLGHLGLTAAQFELPADGTLPERDWAAYIRSWSLMVAI